METMINQTTMSEGAMRTRAGLNRMRHRRRRKTPFLTAKGRFDLWCMIGILTGAALALTACLV